MPATLNSLDVKLEDDTVLNAIADAVFGAASGIGIDPTQFELFAVQLVEDPADGERYLNCVVKPKG